jgi:DNA repair exonuclease SbcCD ATPase subunit
MHADPRDFGKALRQRVEEAAGAVAKAEVQGHFETFGDDIRKRVEVITTQEARKAIADLKADLQADARFGARVIEQIERQLGEAVAKLAALDTDQIEVRQAEIDADIKRLLKQRSDAAADLAAIRKAEGELRQLAKALIGQTELVDHVAKTIGAQIATLRSETEDRATAAANLAVTGMQATVLHKMQIDFTAMREEIEGHFAKLRDEVAELFGSGLVDAFKGPYVEGDTYKRGDMVMFLGSTWIAKRQTTDKPTISEKNDSPWGLLAAGGFGHKLIEKQKRAAAGARKG